MNTFWQDIQFTLRGLKRSPGFAAAAIGTLALGIGATTAMFSTVNAALLKPLPYPNPDGIYAARTALTDGRVTTGLLSRRRRSSGSTTRRCRSSRPSGCNRSS